MEGMEKVASVVLSEEFLYPEPEEETVTYIEVPQIHEVVKHVVVKKIVEVEKIVPRYETEWIEKIVEVPEIRYVDKIVEVMCRDGSVSQVMSRDSSVSQVRCRDGSVSQVRCRDGSVSQVVAARGVNALQAVKAPKKSTRSGSKEMNYGYGPATRVERTVGGMQFIDNEVPVIVAQSVRPYLYDSDEVVDVDVVEYEPEVQYVDVQVPKPINAQIWQTEDPQEVHTFVNIPNAQYNSLLMKLNPHFTESQFETLPFIKEADDTIQFLTNAEGGLDFLNLPPGKEMHQPFMECSREVVEQNKISAAMSASSSTTSTNETPTRTSSHMVSNQNSGVRQKSFASAAEPRIHICEHDIHSRSCSNAAPSYVVSARSGELVMIHRHVTGATECSKHSHLSHHTHHSQISHRKITQFSEKPSCKEASEHNFSGGRNAHSQSRSNQRHIMVPKKRGNMCSC